MRLAQLPALLLLAAACAAVPRAAHGHQLLVLPLSERTHMLVHLKLAVELAQRNHTVHFITPDCLSGFARQTAAHMMAAAAAGRGAGGRAGSADAARQQLQFIEYSLDCQALDAYKRSAQQLDPLRMMAAIYSDVVGRADALLSDAALMRRLRELAPSTDLLVGDVLSFGMLLASKLNLSHVDVDVGTAGPLWEAAMYGAESGAAFAPALGTFLPTTGLAFWQRVLNAAATKVSQAAVRAAFLHPRSALQRMRARHGIARTWPYTQALLLLVNSNFVLEPPRAIPPNTQYVGPVLPEPPQPLPADLAGFVERAGPLGVVVVAFGGTLQPPLAASRMLLRVMRALPHVSFVWKLAAADQAALAAEAAAAAGGGAARHGDGSSGGAGGGSGGNASAPAAVAGSSDSGSARAALSALAPNAFIRTWLPQNDLLGHARVRAFVTQGGYLSMGEAAYHGVPTLGTPFIPGQGELIRAAEDQGRALRLPGDALARGRDADAAAALLALLSDERYHAAARVVAQRLQAVRRPYKQVAADWIEYAAALKGHTPFLHPRKMHLLWHQQALLDVAAVYAAVAALAGVLAYRWLWRRSWQLRAALQHWRGGRGGGKGGCAAAHEKHA